MNSTKSEKDETLNGKAPLVGKGDEQVDAATNNDADNDEASDDGNKEDVNRDGSTVNEATKKKKKKKPKKKPKSNQQNQQTNPPSIPISKLFPDENFPEGEIQDYPKVESDK